jgi:hypothetical protein
VRDLPSEDRAVRINLVGIGRIPGANLVRDLVCHVLSFLPNTGRGGLLAGRGRLEGRSEPFVRSEPLGVVVDVGGDHDLVCQRTLG